MFLYIIFMYIAHMVILSSQRLTKICYITIYVMAFHINECFVQRFCKERCTAIWTAA